MAVKADIKKSDQIFDSGISGGSSLLTVKQLAKWLNIKVKTIYKWVHTNKVPHYKLNNALRFDRAIIQAWLSERS